ncbi:TPA: hypothetical protein NJ392_003531 [Vibrio parahaemolyticus]|uniref:Uncharacterized protein n=4 Tax=Vibrio TaxID=662 RepID=U3AQB1_9VIBR|nr:ABC-three component system middle component 5 [Vibrio azureus]EIU6793004.1 hypothetical protein [Vibrio parahaemolyticus]EIZ1176368.1 hypothetical protein [Vibrio parahaemolyticus]EJE8530230.1 hypothetical protein [Vibrio parahaemolyticus]EJG1097589.1 hypothetical protein [Vibrio parahaemolyticus]ELA9415957.1 hypothetical protein [Vibrio parahaemolyticus]
MLVYNKSIDVNHTVLRLSALSMELDGKEVEKDRLRILDFILAHPVHISKMKLGRDMVKERNVFKSFTNNYQNYSDNNLFEIMKPVQDMAICYLETLGVISFVKENNRLELNYDRVSPEIKSILSEEVNSISSQAVSFIKDYLIDMDLVGDNGLKSASNLMGCKYDAI